MATTPNNENGNLMDEFEEAFEACLLSLTKKEPNVGTNKEEIELEVQKTVSRFLDVARQMEAFFLQKRFLVSTLKPDQLIKDENQNLRTEINRKETLITKHYNRLEEWKAVLSDMQQGGGRPAVEGGIANRPTGGIPQGGLPPQMSAGGQQLQQQHLQTQLQQQQQQKMLQAQQMQQLRMNMMNKMNK